jgi:endonuclease/exonuclease/phosphatase family metal-dependent hydrolase
MEDSEQKIQGGIFVDAFWAMTANVAAQKRMGWHERKNVAAQIFKSVPCHLVGFQEFGLDTWEVLGPARPDLGIIHGMVAGDINVNAIAYDLHRFSPLTSGTFWLSEDGSYKKGWDGDERGASWAFMMDQKRKRKFLIVNVHLDNKGSQAQSKGIELVRDFILKEPKDLPVIVTADSNVSIDSKHPRWKNPELRRPYQTMIDAGFIDSWVATHKHNPIRPFTYHAFQGPDYSGDDFGTYDTEWILVRGFKPLNCVLVRDSIGGIYPSDHYPMMALMNYDD